MEKSDVFCMIRFVKSDILKVEPVQTLRLIWWDTLKAFDGFKNKQKRYKVMFFDMLNNV